MRSFATIATLVESLAVTNALDAAAVVELATVVELARRRRNLRCCRDVSRAESKERRGSSLITGKCEDVEDDRRRPLVIRGVVVVEDLRLAQDSRGELCDVLTRELAGNGGLLIAFLT